MNKRHGRPLVTALLLVGWLLTQAPLSAATPAKVYVILWFDTEDYLLPASDDAALRVADFLSREGVRATFKLVGEKALTLERRRRSDVIAALKKHEIGFHARWHSVHPTPAMYLSNLGWDEGVAEFQRREGPGRDEVERIMGQAPTCYGQPGSSWGPQSYGALQKWKMIYLDAGSHVDLDAKPCYYAGVLNLYKLEHTLRTNLGGPADLEKAQERMAVSIKKLSAEGGGLISIYYHPCEFVHKEFWDGVNFRKGANPPREKWQLPPAKTAEESKIAYATFENYVRFMKRFPEVIFITASDAARIYRDKARGRRFGLGEIKSIAQAVGNEVSFQKHGDYALSASEVFRLLNDYLAARIAGKNPDSLELTGTPLGPTGKVPILLEPQTTDASQFERTCLDVADFLQRQGRIPSTVWLGSSGVPPQAYLGALARVALECLEGRATPEAIEISRANLAAARYVSEDDPKLWTWVIFPSGFRAPALMELARKQAWTLKPALLAPGTE